MKQILWFRRDLRIEDNALLSYASGEVLPIFIFDTNILDPLPSDDMRVSFIYKSVQKLKQDLQGIGLDLQVFHGDPVTIFEEILEHYSDFDEVVCSCDFDAYARTRDENVEKLLPMKRMYDSFLVHPSNTLKSDQTPYKVFTPFYKNLFPLWDCDHIHEATPSQTMRLYNFSFTALCTLESLGFEAQQLPNFLLQPVWELVDAFTQRLENYQEARDYFALEGTSKLSTHLRFGVISVKQLFNRIKPFAHSAFFIRELFWREFYNTILYYFPESAFENFNAKKVPWSTNKSHFKAWCDGETGVPIVDAAMQHLNATGQMHNRLRMIVASFLTKNLFLPWQWGEQYFALKLLDYEASSNIGSWQWGASTGADSVPYFRVFNPYSQSEKFDKEGIFIKSVFPQFQETNPKLFHKENGLQSDLFSVYPLSIVSIKESRQAAIDQFKKL